MRTPCPLLKSDRILSAHVHRRRGFTPRPMCRCPARWSRGIKPLLRLPGLLLFCAVMLLFSLGLHATEKPNFIIIFTDDQGYNDLGCFGSETIRTPHLDQMAKEGRKFTSFYVASPVC